MSLVVHELCVCHIYTFYAINYVFLFISVIFSCTFVLREHWGFQAKMYCRYVGVNKILIINIKESEKTTVDAHCQRKKEKTNGVEQARMGS